MDIDLAKKVEKDILSGTSVSDAFKKTYTWGIDSGTAYRITDYLVNHSQVKDKFLPYAKRKLSIFSDLYR